ncbi:MAG: hypothetical protein WC100_01575 [Sterolibacterium sp.]
MADEIAPTAQAAPVSPAPAPAPVAAAVEPVAAPVATVTPEPAAAPVAPVSAVDSPVVAEPSTVLGSDTKPVEAPIVEKPVEPPKNGEAPAPEGSQSDEPAPLPTYEDFTLPEGVSVEEGALNDFVQEIAEFEVLSKADHAEVQAFAQKLIDRHVIQMKTALERQAEALQQAEVRKKTEWLEKVKADPVLGGNRFNTTTNAALEFIRTHGGDETQQAEFRTLMNETGIGNHPALIRMMANAMNAFREGGPLPAQKPVVESQSKVAKRYGTI